jgi:hypothetical protein
MPVYLSNTLINELQEQTESFLNKAISEWQMIKHSQFALKESPEKWSATQCLGHLNSYGRYYLPVIEKAIQEARKKNWNSAIHFKSGWLGNYFTQLMLPKEDGSLSKKMSSPKDHYPVSNANSHQVIAVFIEQQEKLLLLLEEARSINLNKASCSISIAKFIKLKLGDTFLFFIAHQYRHILQAERALQAAGMEIREDVLYFNPGKIAC